MSTDIAQPTKSRSENRQRTGVAVGLAIRSAYTGMYTQTELAKFVGVAQNTVSRWTTGEVEPSLSDIVAIENACGLTRGHILRAAGLVADALTTEDVIAADPRLDRARRRLVLAAYQAAIERSTP